MSLILYIKDLIVSGKHGIHPHEKTTSQRFKISVELMIASEQALISDGLEDTVDWSQLKRDITNVIEGKSYNLVERLAQEVADAILADKRISKVTITIDKLDAFKSGIPGVKLEVEQTIS